MTPESHTQPINRDDRFATAEETRSAIEGLQHLDYKKLMLIARKFARQRLRGSVVEPEDLLQNAIAKSLDGSRRWNRQVDILKHLDRAMESDAGHEAERRLAKGHLRLMEFATEPAAHDPAPDARLAASEELEGLFAIFSDDLVALELLRLKGNGFSASEIQRQLGIGKTQYDTITKRIRRRLAQHLTDGGN